MRETHLPVKVNPIQVIILHKLCRVVRSIHRFPPLSDWLMAAATNRNQDFDVVVVALLRVFLLVCIW